MRLSKRYSTTKAKKPVLRDIMGRHETKKVLINGQPVICFLFCVLCQLFHKVQQILQPWPHLIKLFTEFMEPQDCLEAQVVSSVLMYLFVVMWCYSPQTDNICTMKNTRRYLN